jgi:murein DD-endopeptidase MepM/ murein hydrolase activator NlpD
MDVVESFAFRIGALVVLSIITGCERPRLELDAVGGDVIAIHEAVAPSVVVVAGSSGSPPIQPHLAIPTAKPAAATGGADTATFATPEELAKLSATLVVPVHGIAPSELLDTYAAPRGSRIHEAIDILAPRGTPVVSATHGRLLKLFNSQRGGLMVYATDASERFILLYGHLDRYAAGLSDGMRLARGQVIGYVGTTGNAPVGTPHLHFGVLRGRPHKSWSRGKPVNPFLLLVPTTPARTRVPVE